MCRTYPVLLQHCSEDTQTSRGPQQRNSMTTLIQAVFLICLPYVITASCMYDQTYTHEGETVCAVAFYMQDVQILPLDTYQVFEDTCFNCTCSQSGLTCCGYGHAAGVMIVPPDCKVLKYENCDYDIVKKDNEEESCFPDQPFQVPYK